MLDNPLGLRRPPRESAERNHLQLATTGVAGPIQFAGVPKGSARFMVNRIRLAKCGIARSADTL